MSKKGLVSIFKQVLKGAEEFKDYSIKSYIQRKANEELGNIEGLKEEEVERLTQHWTKELEIMQRQALLQNMYFSHKSVLEKEPSNKQ